MIKRRLFTRRELIRSIWRSGLVFTLEQLLFGQNLPVRFINVAREAGAADANSIRRRETQPLPA